MKKYFMLAFLFAMGCVWANNLNEIRTQKVVRVGVYESEPPFSKKTDSGFEGFGRISEKNF